VKPPDTAMVTGGAFLKLVRGIYLDCARLS
jgi:hypothetical protein